MIYRPPTEPMLDVVYQDDDLLVLNKPSGLLSVPGRLPTHKDSLQSRAQQQFATATTVHRLDMETSGLIMMALNKSAHVELSRQFEQRLVEKVYIARVYGRPTAESGCIDKPLICDWPNRPRQVVDAVNGKPAKTHWKVIKQEPETALLELRPITGRSHQLRVHLLSIGLPIVGDCLYATGQALNYSDRLQLHSQQIRFHHPKHEAKIEFSMEPDF